MKLIMAVSRDGYVARNDHDDMRWLGTDDKALFRVLTSSGGRCWIGRRSAAFLPQAQHGMDQAEVGPMPELPGRKVEVLGTGHGMTRIEHLRYRRYEQDWLLGGQELALKALMMDLVDVLPYAYDSWGPVYVPLIDEVHLCRSERYAFPDDRRFVDRLTPLLVDHVREPALKTRFGDVVHECWRIARPIPFKSIP